MLVIRSRKEMPMKYVDAHTGEPVPVAEVKEFSPGQFYRVKTVTTKAAREIEKDGVKSIELYDVDVETVTARVREVEQ